MIPPCHNRPPMAAGRWFPTGERKHGLVPIGVDEITGEEALIFALKPVYRWYPSPFEDRCATWDGEGIGPNGEHYPEAHGWDCRGCRWAPPIAIRHGARLSLLEHLRAAEARGEQAVFDLLPVDKPAHNPGVIHTEPVWGDPPGTISHGQATPKPRMRYLGHNGVAHGYLLERGGEPMGWQE